MICNCAETGEVLGDHYKLLPVDLRNIPKLDDIISLANMDPRYVNWFILYIPVISNIQYIYIYINTYVCVILRCSSTFKVKI